VVSVGDGNIISGIHKGFKDLLALGWIERMPRLVGVQAAGSPAVYRAWAAGDEQIVACPAETIADSISVGLPRDGVRAVRAARETGGQYLRVGDDEILDAMRRLARDAAVFAEPAAATAFAGLCHLTAAGQVKPDETVAVVLTGNGLKDIPAALRAAGQPERVAPTLEALREVIAS
jgi:threonine synthase